MTMIRHSIAATFIAIASTGLTGCSRPRSDASAPDSTYLIPRKHYAASLTRQYEARDRGVMPAESLALHDLERRLRLVIGPFSALGLLDSGRINIATLLPGDENSGLADGLLYQARDHTRIFVSTRGIFAAWVAARFGGNHSVPHDPLAALAREDVSNFVFDEDAAVVRYADLPLTPPGKHAVAAMLVDRAQDYCFTCAPGTLLIGLSTGNRIVIMNAPAHDTVPVPRQCREVAEADSNPRKAIDAYRNSGLTDTIAFNRYVQAEAEQFAARSLGSP